ncbi:hypothetical protein K8I61_07010 [bacterium]|nr:hypothetical protein [bacterium]
MRGYGTLLWFLVISLALAAPGCGCGDGDDDDDGGGGDDDSSDDDVSDDDSDDDDSGDDDSGGDDDAADDDTLETVFDENFDTMTVGEPPADPWIVEASGSSSEAIVTDAFPAKAPFGRLVEITKGDGPGDYTYVTRHTGSAPTFAATLEADLYFTIDEVAAVRIYSTGSLGNELRQVYEFYWDIFTDAFRVLYDDGDSIESAECPGPGFNEWFRLRVELDPILFRSTTLIDDVPCAEDTPFMFDAMFLAEIWFVLTAPTSANTIYVDNARYRQAIASFACDDSCFLSNNDSCDDGGTGSSTSVCDYGMDCTDCASRIWPPPAN